MTDLRNRGVKESRDGTWDQILTAPLVAADAEGVLDWTVSVDSTVAWAHQHATNLAREDLFTGRSDTGGGIELQESAARAC